jgi:polyphenol oxidase
MLPRPGSANPRHDGFEIRDREEFPMIDQDRNERSFELSSVGSTRRDFLFKTGVGAATAALTYNVPLVCSAAESDSPALFDGAPSNNAMASAMASETQAPPFNFPSDAPTRIRKSFHDLSSVELADLVTAYQRLKDPAMQGDARYWTLQAQLHGDHCQGSLMEVHQSWWFLPWHHCFLYFYERILASLSANPNTFALPYWDWTLQRGIPNTAYNEQNGIANPFFDASSALYDANRYPTANSTVDSDPNPSGNSPQVADYTNAGYINDQLLTDSTFGDFGGQDPTAGGGPGDLELKPHNNIHNWVGSSQLPFRDMGNLTYAAFDLVFFLHHANIDRLWSKWLAAGNANPDRTQNPQWYSQWFNFHDEKGNAVSLLVDDVDKRKTKITYQEPQMVSIVSAPQTVRFGGNPLVLPVGKVPSSARTRILTAAAPRPHNAPRVRLVLDGAQFPHGIPMNLYVFVNLPNPSIPKDLSSPNFVGSITTVASSGHAAAEMQRPVTLSIDVTSKIHPILEKSDQVQVTLVAAKPAAAQAALAPQLTFKKASFLVRESASGSSR